MSILKQPSESFRVFDDKREQPPPVLKWRGGHTAEKRRRVTRGSVADWVSTGAPVAIADFLGPPEWSKEDLAKMRRELECPKKDRLTAAHTKALLGQPEKSFDEGSDSD